MRLFGMCAGARLAAQACLCGRGCTATLTSTSVAVQVKEAQAEQERCLRDYAQLAGAVLQLAAWTCGAGGDGSGALAALRASAASDENRDSHNRAPVGSCGGLMSPRSAALALQRGPAGECSVLACITAAGVAGSGAPSGGWRVWDASWMHSVA